jgi:hypothetical protein
MFKPEDPELSSDLEWMLQSGQADNPMLAEALVEETYRSVYQFSLSYSQSPIDARKITAEIYGAHGQTISGCGCTAGLWKSSTANPSETKPGAPSENRSVQRT